MTSGRPQAHAGSFCGRTRREFVWEAGGGFGAAALAYMLSADGHFSRASADAVLGPLDRTTAGAASGPMAEKLPHFAAKAKNVIFLFMYGGPSQVDTFDWKPELAKHDGKTIQVKTFGRSGKRNEGRVVGPRFKFAQYGKSGQWVSELFPNLATCVDDIAFLHSMTADSPIHGSAMIQMNSGKILSGSPCLGSWVTYGLGTVNQNMPGFVVMLDPTGGPISGAKNWSSGYMPASYQGVTFRPVGEPVLNLTPPAGSTRDKQRRLLDALGELNGQHYASRADNSNLAARIASYELAFQMQRFAPEAVDVANESAETKKLYGVDEARTQDFGSKCLLARRLVERGVRFIQIYSGGSHNDDNWDAHTNLEKNHGYHAGRTDKPIAGLLTDLKRRGLLDSTLVIWGGEFGRQPTAEYAAGTGRDHNSYGFTMWMAGGGVKGGTSYGATDELGASAVENKLHVKHLHATVLQLMGLDPNRLSYFYGGLDQKLVGVEHVDPIKAII